MPSYELSGLRLRCEIDLAAYAAPIVRTPARDDGPPVEIAVSHHRPPEIEVDHAIDLDGCRVLSFGHCSEGWVLVTDELATFIVAPDGARVVCHPHASCPDEALPQLVVDRVLPHLVDARGGTALHASAVKLPSGKTVGLMGDPGAGKSTLSAGLCPPCAFMADDCLVVELAKDAAWAHPSYQFARLHPDAAAELEAADDIHIIATRTHKHRAARAGAEQRQPLAGLYVLRAGEHVQVEDIGMRDAIVELARHLYRIAPTDKRRLFHELERLERLARAVPLRALTYPRRFDIFDDVRAALDAS